MAWKSARPQTSKYSLLKMMLWILNFQWIDTYDNVIKAIDLIQVLFDFAVISDCAGVQEGRNEPEQKHGDHLRADAEGTGTWRSDWIEMRIKILSKRKCTHLHKKSISCRFSLNVITLFFFVTNWLGSFKNNLLLVNNVKTITTRFILRLPLSPLPTHPHTDTHNYKELHIRRGVRSDVQLSCTETWFQKCSQIGKMVLNTQS